MTLVQRMETRVMTKLLNRYRHYDHVASINTYPSDCSPWPTRLASPKMTPCTILLYNLRQVLLPPFTFLNRAAFANAMGTVRFVTRTATDEMQPHFVVRPCPTATDLAVITKRTAHGSAGSLRSGMHSPFQAC
ncbi:hypothetical protein FOVSG1_002237 [Fusarium oxysporum f. sp. vasinfectum]